MSDLSKMTDRQLDVEIARLNGTIDAARETRTPLLQERNRRQQIQSARRKLEKLTPEERAALATVEPESVKT